MKRLALSLTFLVGITAACRSETVDVKYRGPVDVAPFACTSIDRSSFIRRVCYDHANSYMVVSLNGTYYDYCNIDSATVGSFLAADSMGRFFNASIKDHFDCRTGNVPAQRMAATAQDRFIEFPGENYTTTYDLSTVRILQPGRFLIISTTIDNPDVMKLKLQGLATLQTYCARPDGQYPAPADLLTLGPPDMAVKSIKVESHKTYQTRTVEWDYPYKRLALKTQGGEVERFNVLHCKSPKESEADVTKLNLEQRSSITNGYQSKYVFDCKRGMMSVPLFGDDDPAKALMFTAQGGFFRDYVTVCHKVTHETPYLPESP
jgi:hypothetical protein